MSESEWRKQPGPWAHLTKEQTDEMIDAAVKEERMRCAYIIATEFQEARDTEFDLGFETARKVFAAAILNPNK